MPVIVVDACVAVKWLVRETDTEKAFRLLEDPSNLPIAPDIFLTEVVNAVLKQNRLGHLADDLLDRAMSELDGVMPELVPSGDIMPLAISIADACGTRSTIAFNSPSPKLEAPASSPPTRGSRFSVATG